jgi:hypothetical protein
MEMQPQRAGEPRHEYYPKHNMTEIVIFKRRYMARTRGGEA